MSNKWIIGIIVAIVAVGGLFIFNKSYSPSTPATSAPTAQQASPSTPASKEENTIIYTRDGFSPATLTVKTGATVVWINKSSNQVQVGVDPHPIHTGDRAITNGEFTLDLNQKESKTVTINKTGNFSYHNHLNPGQTGTIIVQY